MNLKSVLANTASRYGDRDAIRHGNRNLTFSELECESNRFANALIRSGVKKADRIALFLPNCPEFIIAFFGIVKIGAVAVPLDQLLRYDEIESILRHCRPVAVIAEKPTLSLIASSLNIFPSVRTLIAVSEETETGCLPFPEFLAQGSPEPVPVEPEPDDVAVLMYTSFAALTPRGVMLTHDSFVKEAAISAAGYRQTENDIMMLFALPMFHVFGLVSAVLGSVCAGSSIIIVPGTGLSIGSFLSSIEQEKGTMYLGVPFIYSLAVDLAEKGGAPFNLDSMRIFASAGAPLSPRIAARFRSLYGKDILDCYGLTEAVSHVTCPALDEPWLPGAAGKPLPGWDVIIGDENGNELHPGVNGEILVRGPVMKGYLDDPVETALALRDGWLHTGDLGRMDENRNLFITGRSKETIIIKGQNVYPSDPESVISLHPGVAEICVLGIADAMRGEIIAAVIVPKPGYKVTEPEIRQLCLDKLAGYKVPRKILFTDKLPRKQDGKPDRDALRQKLSFSPVFPVL